MPDMVAAAIREIIAAGPGERARTAAH